MAIDAAAPGSSWTYGVRLCRTGPGTPVIEAIKPTATVGTFRFLGTSVREFSPTSADTPLISIDGYPPSPSQIPDVLHVVKGYSVTTDCANGPSDPYTELLVGLGREGATGGGWKGIEVSYNLGGSLFVLALDHDLLVCGTATAVECSGSVGTE
jgi:hypothetical protein